VSVPLAAERVTRTGLGPASTSETVMALKLGMEKTSWLFWLISCASGTELTGASLTAFTVIETVASSESPPSWPVTLNLKLSGPL
jgi:hypothetical protein